MKPRDIIFSVVAILLAGMVCDTYVKTHRVANTKEQYENICIGGYQYELVVNEFNEPVWCGENAE